MPERDGTYWDRQEVRSPVDREVAIFGALPGLIRHAMDNASFYASRFERIDPDTINSREMLNRLPVIRKQDLPFRGQPERSLSQLIATPMARLSRMHVSPGPIYSPEGNRSDYWRFARAFYAAGFRPGQAVHNAFPYHLVPAGFMADAGARALGCPVVPAGDGPLDSQFDAIEDIRPVGFAGKPSTLIHLLQRARAENRDHSSISRALVSGETFFEAKRAYLRNDFGIDAYQCYATSDTGLIGYETEARSGLLVDESMIVEIVEPGGTAPVGDGEAGEIVVTVFNPDYPLIRFATGDLSSILHGESPCGRTNMRLAGWLGRVAEITAFNGVTLYPQTVIESANRHNVIGSIRLFVANHGLRLELEATDRDADLEARLATTLRDLAGLCSATRIDVVYRQPGELGQGSRLIEDQRQAD